MGLDARVVEGEVRPPEGSRRVVQSCFDFLGSPEAVVRAISDHIRR
jgi:hypothetical protein